MKLRNKKVSLCASTLVLALALPLLLSSCSDEADTLPGAGGNDVARTLNINVGPKPGFIPGNADGSADSNAPGTHATVDEGTGVMEWQEGDRIFVLVDCNDAADTKPRYTLVRTATSTWAIYEGYLTTYDADGNLIDLGDHTPVSAIKLPLGATGIDGVRVNYTDSPTRFVPRSGPDAQDAERVDFQDGGSRDFMTSTIFNPSIDAAVTLDLKRGTLTRLHFTGGLTPGKKYYVDGFRSPTAFGEGMTDDGSKIPFTAAPDGSLTLCAGINGTAQTVTLKEKDDDGDDTNDKVVYSATSDVAYGRTYRCIIPGAGGIDPGSNPDLLTPAPIVTGNKVYAVNGYWVTATDETEYVSHQWAASTGATVMDTDPCSGHGNWRMPTMKDFEAMMGWTDTKPWSQELSEDECIGGNVLSDKDAWCAAFGYENYWSSDACTPSDDCAWYMHTDGFGVTAYYGRDNKTYSHNVRCVQPQ